MSKKKYAKKQSYRSNILALFVSFSMLLFLLLIHPILSADTSSESQPSLDLPSLEREGSGITDTASQALNSTLSRLLMETKLFDSVAAASNLVQNPEFSIQASQSFSASSERKEGYLKDRIESSFSAPQTEQKESASHFLPDEISSMQIIPSGMLIPKLSSLSVIATVKKVYQEQTLLEAGELQEITFSQFMQANNRPVQIPTDPEWYVVLSAATGIPQENILFSIYEVPVFKPLPKPENPAVLVFQRLYLPLLFIFGGILFLEPFLILRKAGRIKQAKKQAAEIARQTAKVNSASRSSNANTKMPSASKLPADLLPSEDERLKKIKKFIAANPDAASNALKDYMKR